MKSSLPRKVLMVFGVLAFVFFVYKVDFRQLVLTMRTINLAYLFWALIFTALNVAAKAFRWIYMVRRSTGQTISFPLAFLSIFAGVASSSLAPAKTIDLAKPLIIKELYPQTKLGYLVGVVFVERLADLAILIFALVFFTLLSQAVISSGIVILLLSIIVLSVLTAGNWVPLLQKCLAVISARSKSSAVKKLMQLLSSVCEPLEEWAAIRQSMSLLAFSAVAQIMELMRAFFIFKAVGLEIDFVAVALAFASSAVLGLLSMVPGGIGITETSQNAILAKLAPGAALSQIGGGVLIDRVISYYGIVLIGAIIMLVFKIRPETKEESLVANVGYSE